MTSGGQLVFGGGNGPLHRTVRRRRLERGRDRPAGHYIGYGHFTSGNDGWLVTDGYYEEPGDPPSHGAVDLFAQAELDDRTIEWRPICRHGSSWKSQDEHPHPIFDHAGRSVFFTSDRRGQRAVYRVDVS